MQRIFIGIPVDRQLQREINKRLKPIEKRASRVRWVVGNNRHLTLAFPGNVPRTGVKQLSRLFDASYQHQQAFSFRLTRLTRFPGPAGRIIALTGDRDAPMNELSGITRSLLQKLDIEFDRKVFRPHITLARFRDEQHFTTSIDRQVELTLKVNRVRLYESTLAKSGSIYSTLKETHLAPCDVCSGDRSGQNKV